MKALVKGQQLFRCHWMFTKLLVCTIKMLTMEFLNHQLSIHGWPFAVINAFHVARAFRNISDGYFCQEPEKSFWDFFITQEETCIALAEVIKENVCYLLATVGLNFLMIFMCSLLMFARSASIKAWLTFSKFAVDRYKKFMLCKYCGCKAGGCLTNYNGYSLPFWFPKKPYKQSFANFPRRLKAMKMFALLVRVCVNHGYMAKDSGFEERSVLDNYVHDEIVLFPKCVQKRIGYWYPLPE